MIYYGINDIYRKEMYRFDEKQILLFLERLDEPTKDRYLRIMIVDGYQVLQRRINSLESDKYYQRLYSILNKSDFKHIKEVLEDNYALLQRLFINAKGFWSMPIIDRCLLLTDKSNYQDYFKLIKLDPLYLVDACVYCLQKDIQSINYYYNDYLAKLGSKFLPNFYQLVMLMMDKLKEENREMYDQNFLEILKGFYIGNKFMNSLDENYSIDIIDYINKIEQENLEVVAEDLSLIPKKFTKVISVYLAYQSDLAGSNDIKDFIDKNISKEMIKKLKIDNN